MAGPTWWSAARSRPRPWAPRPRPTRTAPPAATWRARRVHPARHRALRELGAFGRQMADHWDTLAGRFDGAAAEALREGSQSARDVVGELQALARDRGLEVGVAALSAGRVARARPPVPDGALERNQALRFALLDAQHVLTLIDYLAELALADDDPEAHATYAAWANKLRPSERAVRKQAVGIGKTPDAAVEPISAAQKLQYAFGWLGEAADRLRRPRSA